MSSVIDLATALIRCPSVTPVTAGVYDVLEQFLKPLGFSSQRQVFTGDGAAAVENIYFRYGKEGPNFCFAGHTDVVPPGDEAAWKVPPFEPQIIDGELYGRGAEDMKGAIAAFCVAARAFIDTDKNFSGSISLLITQDEEGWAVNGTRKMLEWLSEQGEKLTHCIVGEPTNPEKLGEMVKVGRRGSVYFTLTVNGKQGHVAYPDRADNPIPRLLSMLHKLETTPLDNGSEFFQPSNLEITTVDVGNPTGNVIPASASAQFNVRFNELHTGESVEAWVRNHLASLGDHELKVRITGESFLTKDRSFAGLVAGAVEKITGISPKLSTTGGTSDARFIKDYCPVVEFGTTGRTAHMVDERVEVRTLEGLTGVYSEILTRYFSS